MIYQGMDSTQYDIIYVNSRKWKQKERHLKQEKPIETIDKRNERQKKESEE